MSSPNAEGVNAAGKRFDTVCQWADLRARQSVKPERFLWVFHDELATIRRHGEAAVLEKDSTRLNPTDLAAEIEALAATRAMRTWGTNEGLCLTRRKRPGEVEVAA